ncbi:MAG: heterodisulfide reductase-related iron-sulfur binding cluster [Candidatus Eremiobacteraeota bacterium]|nr:heterodisulfide reductase-related iron-sulfur binding cluster [Candidatus Eremiobacteraeota bacterium]
MEDLDRCTRCGLCEQACPTYRLFQFEPDSPRGRIFLMKELALGNSPVTEHLAEHLYQCLGCRACETVCPAGVPYGRLLEHGRAQVEALLPVSPKRRRWRWFRSLAFERLLPRRGLFQALMAPARLLQALPALKRVIAALLPERARKLMAMIPELGDGEPLQPEYRAQGERRARVALFSGCVMSALFRQTHAATARVLARNGCDVSFVADAWCCGALNIHAGERTEALRMARHNIAAFEAHAVDAIVVNSAGCGAVMKEYAALLRDDERYRDKAQRFSALVKDANEFLCELGLAQTPSALPKRVTYQDACHLAHGQGIRQQPRALLRSIPQLAFVELPYADRCCGAAGIYSLTHPDISQRILDEKLDSIVDSGAEVVTTSNPGCHMQLLAGITNRRLPITVCHVMELLDGAYRQRVSTTQQGQSGPGLSMEGSTPVRSS